MANRVSQVPVEIFVVPSEPKARVSQAPVEVFHEPVVGAIVSQVPVEVFLETVDISGGPPRVTQAPLEAVSTMVVNARVTQAATEAVLYPTDELGLVTQAVIEVIIKGSVTTLIIETCCLEAVQTAFPFYALDNC